MFIAVLGASAYCCAEASWGQGEESWLRSHARALESFGGSAEILVPDYVPGNIVGVEGMLRSPPIPNGSGGAGIESFGLFRH